LWQALKDLPVYNHPDLILGCDDVDDSGVMRINDEKAIIVSVDFFPAIVDDPYIFGQVAAVNAMSDIYAMGGSPLCALNIVSFPEDKLPISVMRDMLKGGAEKVSEAGAIVVGGHTMKDSELKYGLSVTGLADPAAIIITGGALPGDSIVLTKPLGSGIYSTALKADELPPELENDFYGMMTTLNRDASEVMKELEVHACTDVTGFGLLGHALEMAESSSVSIELELDALPLLENLRDYAERGFLTGGGLANYNSIKEKLVLKRKVSPVEQMIMCDPQTSGGLLVAIPAEKAGKYIETLRGKGHKDVSLVGRVISAEEPGIFIT